MLLPVHLLMLLPLHLLTLLPVHLLMLLPLHLLMSLRRFRSIGSTFESLPLYLTLYFDAPFRSPLFHSLALPARVDSFYADFLSIRRIWEFGGSAQCCDVFTGRVGKAQHANG